MPEGAPTGAWSLRARTHGPEETRRLASALAGCCVPGDLVLLLGDLGAGKTTFAQGFARGLGVAGPVTSPTFTLVRDYPLAGSPAGLRRLLHADLYRLDSLAEVEDLGLPELVEDASVALVEWGERGAPVLGDEFLTVRLAPGEGEDDRVLEVTGRGRAWAGRRQEIALALEGTGSS